MVYNAWNTAIKLSWSCPRWTRTFLVQKVLECGETSAKTELHKNLQVAIPDLDSWKIRYLSSLLSQLMEAKHLVLKERSTQLQSLIDSLVR